MKEDKEGIRLLIRKGTLINELEYERALIADRTLRLAKNDPSVAALRKQLRDLISRYEKTHWSDENKITDHQLKESDRAEVTAEKERKFIQRRKELILSRLRHLGVRQQDLGMLLGHNKSYTSELLNGIRSFSSGDLVLIHRLLKIDLKDLFSTAIPPEILERIKISVSRISSTRLKLRDMELVPA